MKEKMYILGGDKVCNKEFEKWPIYRPEYLAGVEKVLKSGWWGGIRDDSEVAEFEKRFAAYIGVEYAIGVSSGSVALVMALKSLNLKPGTEVIVPGMSFIATATAVSILGLIPVFVDIDPKTHCILAKEIENNISQKTRGIIPVHIGGYPCDMERIMKIAKKNNLYVIEDCCQAHGAEWNGKKVGSYGDIGVFSFASTKNMTSGEGGILLTNNEKIYKKLRSLRNHGRINSMDYYHERLGLNFRMNEFQAKLLDIQLDLLDEQLRIKNRNVEYLVSKIKKMSYKWIEFLEYRKEVTVHAFFSFAFLYKPSFFEDIPKEFMCKIIRSEGIPVGEASIADRAIFDNPIYTDSSNEDYCPSKKGDCKNTVKAYQEIIVLGQSVRSAILLGGYEEMDYIINVIKKININKKEISIYYKNQK